MYSLRPAKLYMLDSVENDPAALARVRGMVAALGRKMDEVVRFSLETAGRVAQEIQAMSLPDKVPNKEHTRCLAFTKLHYGEKRPDIEKLARQTSAWGARSLMADLLGCFPAISRRLRENDQQLNHVCWCAYEFGTMAGCPHGCQYCGTGKSSKVISLAVNVEEFVANTVEPALRNYPWQKSYRMIGWGADQIAFEPEYDLFDPLTRAMAKFPERYAIFHTKSGNVRWMKDLPHRDRLFGVWSLMSDDVTRQVEPGAPSGSDRVNAARFCQEIGLHVRVKFKPIVPIRNWREGYARIIADLFRQTRPESVGFCVLMWMKAEDLKKKIDPALLDPDCVAAMDEAAPWMKDVHTGPFPPAVRAEIYDFFITEVRRRDPRVPIYISTETREMWDLLGARLGQNKRAFLCGCGPYAVPGRRLLVSPEIKFTTYEAADR